MKKNYSWEKLTDNALHKKVPPPLDLTRSKVSKNIFLIISLHCVKVKRKVTVGECVQPLPPALSECKQIMPESA